MTAKIEPSLPEPQRLPNDVAISRRVLHRRRMRHAAWILGVLAMVLLVREAIGVLLYAAGNFRASSSVLTWPLPLHIPGQLVSLAPAGALVFVLALVLVGPLLAAGRSPHSLVRPEDIGIGFADVVGAGPVLEDVRRTLDLFLAHKTFHESTGGSTRRGILFEGPPGTGKTYMAKAIAAEAGVPFLFVSSSAFQSMFYGQTNRKVRSYFRALRAHARREGGAIGFIEEIDAIGASRHSMRAGATEGVSGVVNELLIQLQSFDQPTPGEHWRRFWTEFVNRWLPTNRQLRAPVHETPNVLVIGATNRAGDLDPALLRPGRFDRIITVDLPDRDARRQLIDYYLGKKRHDTDLDDEEARDNLAAVTMGYSPVMIEHLFDEALVHALRRGAMRCSSADVAQARLTEELGMTQSVSYSAEEKRRIATHEAGHATVAWLVAPERKLEVLSIVKRRSALGLLAHSETQEHYTATRSDLDHLLLISMGGLVAEEQFFGEASNGVAGDLAMATKLACQMVGAFGMGASLVSLDAAQMPNTDIVARVLADEASRSAVHDMLREAHETVTGHLEAATHVVVALRDALLERSELIGTEIAAVADAAQAAHGATPTSWEAPRPRDRQVP